MKIKRTITAFLLFGTLLGAGSAEPVSEMTKEHASSDHAHVGFSVENMDRTADPRKDFFRYAVGGWIDRTVIPPSKGMVMAATTLLDDTDRKLLQLAREAAAAEDGPKYRRQVGDFFLSAMDTNRLEKLDIKPILEELANIEKTETREEFARLSGRFLTTLDVSPFLVSGVSPDSKNNTVYAFQVVTTAGGRGLGLAQHEYVGEGSESVRKLYLTYLTGLLEEAGSSPAEAAREASLVLELEKELMDGLKSPVEMADREGTYNKLTLEELRARVPGFDFDVYFDELGVTDPPETVIVPDPKGLDVLQDVLDRRKPAELQSLFRAMLLRQAAPFLSSRFSDKQRAFLREKSGLEESPPREKDVMDIIAARMAHPLSRLYVERFLDESTRKAVRLLFAGVKDEFKARLEANSWLDETTQATALAKLANIDFFIGKPDDDGWIDYDSVVIDPGDFYGNHRRLVQFGSRRNFGQLGNPVVRDKFAIPGATTPISFNAALLQQFVDVEMTAVFAHPPYYTPGADVAVNFGAIGAVLGHELTHGFDSKGRFYDENGNLRGWWTKKDSEEFQRRAQVLVEQYDGYEVQPGVFANGKLELSENIADLGGITLAYQALQTYQKENGKLPVIDGLTPEQRFFVSWAQVWVAKTRPELMKVLVAADVHAPSQVRAFGPLVHLQEFHDAFDIQPGDAMYRAPEERVVIW